MQECFDTDISVLEGTYEEEQRKYYLLSSIWMELNENQCPGNSVALLKLDLNTCTLSDVQGIPETPFSIQVPKNIWVSGFSGWFTVDFLGNEEFHIPNFVRLCTGPRSGPSHWGQQVTGAILSIQFIISSKRRIVSLKIEVPYSPQVFYLEEPLHFEEERDGIVDGTVTMTRKRENVRLYNVNIAYRTLSDDSRLPKEQQHPYEMQVYEIP